MSLNRFSLSAALLAFVAILTQRLPLAHAQTSDSPILHRGTNLSSWLANARNRQVFTSADFQRIKQEGFDFVRLPINPDFFKFSLSASPGDAKTLDYGQIDSAIQQITQTGLTVVLDIHPGRPFMTQLEAGGAAEDRFVELWGVLADRYKNYPASSLAFELLNEPAYYNKSSQYNQLMAKVIQRIRATDKNRLLIVEAPAVTSLYPADALKTLEISQDPNVAYDVHFYQPYIITHQGINFGFDKTQIRNFINVPYPSSMVDKTQIKLAPGADPEKAMAEIDDYVKEGWDRNRISAYLTPVAEWAQKNKVRVVVLEYGVLKDGVFRPNVDPGTRYRWIGDATSVMDSLQTGQTPYIGRSVWDESDNFGIDELIGDTIRDPHDGSVRFVKHGQGTRKIEPAAAKALGLTPSP